MSQNTVRVRSLAKSETFDGLHELRETGKSQFSCGAYLMHTRNHEEVLGPTGPSRLKPQGSARSSSLSESVLRITSPCTSQGGEGARTPITLNQTKQTFLYAQ